MSFIKKLRELSDGKPVGFKLCMGHRDEFVALARAMRDTGITPWAEHSEIEGLVLYYFRD